MSNGWEQAKEYVENMRRQGCEENDIRAALRQSGWNDQQLESLVGGTKPAPPPPATTPSAQPYPPAVRPPPVRAAPVEYAGFWRRFLAVFIDGILLNIVTVPVAIVVGLVSGLAATGTGGDVEDLMMLGVQGVGNGVGIIIGWLYYALMESSSTQATLGKMAIGMVVTDLEGNRIGFGRATGRFFAKYISLLTLFIGYIMAGFTEKKQALHDMIAGTLVVMKPRY